MLATGHYEVVAEVYVEAVAAGDRPVVAVRETFGVPAGTAARWVKEARRRGLIPPTTQGKVPGWPCNHKCPSCCSRDL